MNFENTAPSDQLTSVFDEKPGIFRMLFLEYWLLLHDSDIRYD